MLFTLIGLTGPSAFCYTIFAKSQNAKPYQMWHSVHNMHASKVELKFQFETKWIRLSKFLHAKWGSMKLEICLLEETPRYKRLTRRRKSNEYLFAFCTFQYVIEHTQLVASESITLWSNSITSWRCAACVRTRHTTNSFLLLLSVCLIRSLNLIKSTAYFKWNN